MKAIEFAYWLQGHFEISGSALKTEAQLALVLKKADSVTAGNDAAEQKAAAYVGFARGVLLSARASGSDPVAVSTILSEELNKLFIHAIDPTIKGDQQQLRRTHRPENNGGFEAMC